MSQLFLHGACHFGSEKVSPDAPLDQTSEAERLDQTPVLFLQVGVQAARCVVFASSSLRSFCSYSCQYCHSCCDRYRFRRAAPQPFRSGGRPRMRQRGNTQQGEAHKPGMFAATCCCCLFIVIFLLVKVKKSRGVPTGQMFG